MKISWEKSKSKAHLEENRGGSNNDGRGDAPKFKAQQEKCGATYRAFVHHRATGNIYEYDGTRSVVNVYENSEEWKKDIN